MWNVRNSYFKSPSTSTWSSSENELLITCSWSFTVHVCEERVEHDVCLESCQCCTVSTDGAGDAGMPLATHQRETMHRPLNPPPSRLERLAHASARSSGLASILIDLVLDPWISRWSAWDKLLHFNIKQCRATIVGLRGKNWIYLMFCLKSLCSFKRAFCSTMLFQTRFKYILLEETWMEIEYVIIPVILCNS